MWLPFSRISLAHRKFVSSRFDTDDTDLFRCVSDGGSTSLQICSFLSVYSWNILLGILVSSRCLVDSSKWHLRKNLISVLRCTLDPLLEIKILWGINMRNLSLIPADLIWTLLVANYSETLSKCFWNSSWFPSWYAGRPKSFGAPQDASESFTVFQNWSRSSRLWWIRPANTRLSIVLAPSWSKAVCLVPLLIPQINRHLRKVNNQQIERNRISKVKNGSVTRPMTSWPPDVTHPILTGFHVLDSISRSVQTSQRLINSLVPLIHQFIQLNLGETTCPLSGRHYRNIETRSSLEWSAQTVSIINRFMNSSDQVPSDLHFPSNSISYFSSMTFQGPTAPHQSEIVTDVSM